MPTSQKTARLLSSSSVSKIKFPGKSKELRGRWVGISEHIGNKMTYKIITDDTGEEVSRSAIRPANDPSMRNLREDPITIIDDLILEEDTISPADDILNRTNTGARDDVQGIHFRKPTDDQSSHFQQDSSPRPKTKTMRPKPISKNKQQKHVCPTKLRDLHHKDPTTVTHRYPTRQRLIVKTGQTVIYSDDTLPIGADNLPTNNNNNNNIDADTNDDDEILIPPTDPTTPSVAHQEQFLRNRDTHIAEFL
jgi:hypothetical protein